VHVLVVALLLLLLVVAGCGAQEQAEPLPRGLADELAERSDAVAERLEAGDPCGARAEAEALQQQTIAAVNAGRVPPRFQEELTSAVGGLVASIECVPADPEPATTAEDDDDDDGGDDDDDDDERGGKGKGNGPGKGKGKGRRA